MSNPPEPHPWLHWRTLRKWKRQARFPLSADEIQADARAFSHFINGKSAADFEEPDDPVSGGPRRRAARFLEDAVACLYETRRDIILGRIPLTEHPDFQSSLGAHEFPEDPFAITGDADGIPRFPWPCLKAETRRRICARFRPADRRDPPLLSTSEYAKLGIFQSLHSLGVKQAKNAHDLRSIHPKDATSLRAHLPIIECPLDPNFSCALVLIDRFGTRHEQQQAFRRFLELAFDAEAKARRKLTTGRSYRTFRDLLAAVANHRAHFLRGHSPHAMRVADKNARQPRLEHDNAAKVRAWAWFVARIPLHDLHNIELHWRLARPALLAKQE